MSFKDIQVHVNSNASCTNRLHVAASMAEKQNAHLTGVFLRPRLHLPNYFSTDSTVWLSHVEADYEKEMNNNEGEARKIFDEVTSQYQVEATWQAAKGNVYSALTKEAGYADLLVLGQPNSHDEANKSQDLTDHIVLTTGRPCLIVPYAGVFENVGKHPLIAWNGSRESNRALHDAMPLLEQAETVTVLLSETGISGDLPDTKIARHLARHDVKVMTKTMREKKRDTSNAFLSYLVDDGHDLLVMGAYGHSKFRELILGGMTHEIMQTMTVPVLMSH